MTSLGDALKEVIKSLGMEGKVREVLTIEAWAAVAGYKVNAVTESVQLRGNTLYVRVNSAMWRHELHLARDSWRDRLNETLQDVPPVQEIVFR